MIELVANWNRVVASRDREVIWKQEALATFSEVTRPVGIVRSQSTNRTLVRDRSESGVSRIPLPVKPSRLPSKGVL